MWGKAPQQLYICCPEKNISSYKEIQIVYAANETQCKEKLIKWGHDITDWKFIHVYLRGRYGKAYDISQVEFGKCNLKCHV
jgi:hypothetical protein